MLVLSMNSKRQRRPNVRLAEVGDVPAAFSCGFSRKNRNILGHNTFENDPLNHTDTNQDHIYGFALDTISPLISADLQQNRENSNPNSSKSAFDVVKADDMDTPKLKLNFGTITRKCRIMKKRSRNTNGANNAFGNAWSSKIGIEDGKECNVYDSARISSSECSDDHPATGFKKACDLDAEEPAYDMEPSGFDAEEPAYDMEPSGFDADEPANDTGQQRNFSKFLQEDFCDEGNNPSPVSDHVLDEINYGGSDVNIVSRWLEEKGFGKYAGVFEVHEVDEEALLLLTLEDLKEMGVFAIGSRRKLYTAIQQLRKSDVSVDDRSI